MAKKKRSPYDVKTNTLPNGLTIVYDTTPRSVFAINVMIQTGSDNETPEQRGISHVLEHAMFETKKRSAQQLSREVEQYGADLNAYTSSSVTCYHIKIPIDQAKIAIDIALDILTEPRLSEEMITKEKSIVLEEIRMSQDEPKQYQWLMLKNNLFDDHRKFPVYGDAEIVKKFTKKDLETYYQQQYTPQNTIISLIGATKKEYNYVIKILKSKKWNNQKSNHHNTITKNMCITSTKTTEKTISKFKSNLQYCATGYEIPGRSNPDSYTFEVIQALLAKGQSGILFDEVRNKRGLTYDVGIFCNVGKSYGLFVFYTSASKDKISKIRDIFYRSIQNLRTLPPQEIEEAKSYINGDNILGHEDSGDYADFLCQCLMTNSKPSIPEYLKNIKKVTRKDIQRVISKYLNHKGVTVLIE